MHFLISSGNGVKEANLAVGKFLRWLKQNYKIEVLTSKYGGCKECYKLVIIKSSNKELLKLIGQHKWLFISPFRPKHKRKSWYFNFVLIKEQISLEFNENKIIYQSFKSPKKGGQHTNTTNSGVRAIYKELNLEVISTEQRSQHQNKKIAKERLLQKYQEILKQNQKIEIKKKWTISKELQVGKAKLVFKDDEIKTISFCKL